MRSAASRPPASPSPRTVTTRARRSTLGMKTELLTIFSTIRHYASRAMPVTSSYDALRDAIVRGDIAPDARLVESDLSTTFEMSRGAVRTALIRLEQDGLVVREPHRGA